MVIIIIITLYPFWEQVVLSFSSGAYISQGGFKIIPKGFTFNAYKLMFNYDLIWMGYRNSIIRAVSGTTISLLVTSLIAYPLSKQKMPFNKQITGFLLFTMLFSGGLIPSYLLIKNLGLLNNMLSLILPGMVSAWNVLIMRNFFKSIPQSLEESAFIDGAGWLKIFTSIVLPLSKPVLATVGLWVMVGHWNSWFDAMIYIQDPRKSVLPIVLRKIVIANNFSDMERAIRKTAMDRSSLLGEETLKSAIIMMSMLPMLIIYPFLQKYFTKGIMIGSVKG